MSADVIEGMLDFDPAQLKRKYEEERTRRLRVDGRQQYARAGGKFARFRKDPWVDPDTRREPLREHTTVIVAGGGFGGLLQGARLREAGVSDVRVIEVGGDFGGTWYWNRYPGAMCDIEAHVYLPLLEELDYAPRTRYSYAPEMLEHSQRIGQAYGLYERALFQTAITGAEWDEADGRWHVRTDRGDELTSDFLVLACGRQSLPKLPNLPGIDRFRPHTFHTSRWDYAYTGGGFDSPMTGLADKRVGLIGTGATAVQVLPELAKTAKEVVVFQRTPSSVGFRGNRETPRDWVDMSRPGWQQERRVNFLLHSLGLTPETDHIGDGWTELFRMLRPETPQALEARLGRPPTIDEIRRYNEMNDYRVMNKVRARIEEIVKDPETAEALKPWYRWLCKRPCFHDDYLDAFNQDNVRLVDTGGRGVEGFTEDAVLVDGAEFPVDCLIFATGFDSDVALTELTGFEIRGRNASLSEHFADGWRTLHGISTDGFPNLFFIGNNPQTASVTANAVHHLDELSTHVAYVIAEAERRGARRVEPDRLSVDAYVELIRSSEKNKETLRFYQACTPGYYNAEGAAAKGEDLFAGGRYGDGAIAYYAMLEKWRAEGDLDGFRVTSDRARSRLVAGD